MKKSFNKPTTQMNADHHAKLGADAVHTGLLHLRIAVDYYNRFPKYPEFASKVKALSRLERDLKKVQERLALFTD